MSGSDHNHMRRRSPIRRIASLASVSWIVVIAAAMAVPCSAQAPARTATFSGTRALEDVRQLVAIGPRVAGTPGAAKTRDYITAQLKAAGLTVKEQAFDVATPRGMIHMINLRAVVPSSRKPDTDGAAQYLILAGHYDTKLLPGFVGANDGGSSAALLIEIARVLKPRTLPMDVELLFLDGEEAVVDWERGNDHTYGSRYYVSEARKAGTLTHIAALVLVDMIGDRDLHILRESNSTPWLTKAVWDAAARLGRREFESRSTSIQDDHLEFLTAGVPAVDIIDLEYSSWHETSDTFDKLSAASLQAVGDVVMEALKTIAARPRP